jgi:hypothetical protein
MNLANEVSSMESEIESLRAENELLKQHKAVIEFENDQLKRTNARLHTERDTFMRRAEQIKVLLDQTGASLVQGINKYHESERDLARLHQSGDSETIPLFLTGGQTAQGEPNGDGREAAAKPN